MVASDVVSLAHIDDCMGFRVFQLRNAFCVGELSYFDAILEALYTIKPIVDY